MYWTQKHVLVCTASHCAQKGSNDLIGRLRLEIVRKKFDAEILVNNCGTIDLCDIGPNVVIYPDNVILSGVTAKDVPALVRYLRGEGDPPGEITGFDSPAELARRNAANLWTTFGEVIAARPGIVRRAPSESETAEWIAAAGSMEKAVTH